MAIIINTSSSLNFQFTPAGGILAGTSVPILKAFKFITQSSGTALDQCDLFYANTLTFVTSTPQNLDLTSLTDPLGISVNFARIRMVAIRVNSVTDGQALIMGNAGANEWSGAAALLNASGTLRVLASTASNHGFMVMVAPNTTGFLVDGTHKVLKLDPGTGAFTADIFIAGASV